MSLEIQEVQNRIANFELNCLNPIYLQSYAQRFTGWGGGGGGGLGG